MSGNVDVYMYTNNIKLLIREFVIPNSFRCKFIFLILINNRTNNRNPLHALQLI